MSYSANEHVQRLFKLGFNRQKKTTEFYSNDLANLVKRHDLDLGSMEAKCKYNHNSLLHTQLIKIKTFYFPHSGNYDGDHTQFARTNG